MLRDYSIRGFVIGAIATALYIFNYVVAAVVWGVFGVVYLAFAIRWEILERSGQRLPSGPRASPNAWGDRSPGQAPDLRTPSKDEDGPGKPQ